jgi:hypothetical protein
MAAQVSLRFLGVRAIHSCPGRENSTTGGNTGCIEFRDGNQRIFVNAGFGINIAGDELLTGYIKAKVPVNCTVLFSDFLSDSTMGLPFFTPIHFKSTEIDILTGIEPSIAKDGLDDAASNLFSPFRGLGGFRADVSVRTLDNVMHLGHWRIEALKLPHPLTPYPVTIWRLKHNDGFDVGISMLCDPTPQNIADISRFFAGCNSVICAASDSPTHDQWDKHRTCFEDACQIALNSGAEELFLTQFHPEMNDQALQQKLLKTRNKINGQKHSGNGKSLAVHLGSEIEIFTLYSATQKQKAG